MMPQPDVLNSASDHGTNLRSRHSGAFARGLIQSLAGNAGDVLGAGIESTVAGTGVFGRPRGACVGDRGSVSPCAWECHREPLRE